MAAGAATEFACEAAGKADGTHLDHGLGRAHAHVGSDTADIDDAAPTLLHHMRNYGAADVKRTGQIDGNGAIPCLQRFFQKVALAFWGQRRALWFTGGNLLRLCEVGHGCAP